jgi:catechol 2,3-dioxygenase-like lactoylglutathione lyase family enzyme
MLADHPVNAAVPAQDIERAKRFYKEKLELSGEETPAGIFLRCGRGTRLFVFPSSGAPSGTHTQAGWQVQDIRAEVADLKSRGVVFEEYDTPGLKTVDGVAESNGDKAAWFKDSEGNLIGLFQGVS